MSSLLAEIDAAPIIVQMESILTRIGPDGTRTVLSRPAIQTLDQTTGMISIGQSGGEGLELTLTPKVILPNRLKEKRVATADANPPTPLVR